MRWLVLIALVASCRIDLQSEMPYVPPVMADADTSCVKGTSGTCQCVEATNTACMNAAGHSDFTFINNEILNTNCMGSSCHETKSSSNAKKNPYGDATTSYASLVNFASNVTPGTTLVVAGQPRQSYAMVILNFIPAEEFLPSPTVYPKKDPGLMPQSNPTLCCQKLQVINDWIAAGAMNN